jgi:glyoxylase-like metal-dependent hydrolase (beta-lactamase superfamily II)
MGDYILVVDALEDAPLEGEVMAAIAETVGDKPVRYVLNTHTHYDHVSLNGAFVDRFGAEIVNQRTTTIDPAGRVFESPGRKVCMIPMPGCHTREDCVIWAPDDRVLFAGDIFGWGLIPSGGLLNAELRGLLRNTYQRLIDFDAEIVVPGHGPVCGAAELVRWVEYFDWLLETVGGMAAAGKSDGDIKATVTPPDDMLGWWRFVAWKHADALSKVLTSARRGALDA